MQEVLTPTPMTVKEKLIQIMDELGLKQAQVAKGLGRSSAAISTYLADKYQGDISAIETDIENYIRKQIELKRINKLHIPFVFTDNARAIFDTMRLCHMNDEIGVVIGDPGTGKTVALRHYAELSPDVILIEADLTYTAKILMQEIGRKLKIDISGSLHEVFDAIVDKVKESHRLIIIDESEHLPFRAMDLLRRIKDKADVGIIMAGTKVLLRNLKGKHGEYAQLYSRVGICTELTVISKDNFRELVTRVFGNDEYAEMIARVTKQNGRSFEYIVKRINNIRKDRPVNKSIIEDAASLLIN
jgi:DNA transposition AAA+ family ATPase